jgi:rRNA maturation endonuclease Nob1
MAKRNGNGKFEYDFVCRCGFVNSDNHRKCPDCGAILRKKKVARDKGRQVLVRK